MPAEDPCDIPNRLGVAIVLELFCVANVCFAISKYVFFYKRDRGFAFNLPQCTLSITVVLNLERTVFLIDPLPTGCIYSYPVWSTLGTVSLTPTLCSMFLVACYLDSVLGSSQSTTLPTTTYEEGRCCSKLPPRFVCIGIVFSIFACGCDLAAIVARLIQNTDLIALNAIVAVCYAILSMLFCIYFVHQTVRLLVRARRSRANPNNQKMGAWRKRLWIIISSVLAAVGELCFFSGLIVAATDIVQRQPVGFVYPVVCLAGIQLISLSQIMFFRTTQPSTDPRLNMSLDNMDSSKRRNTLAAAPQPWSSSQTQSLDSDNNDLELQRQSSLDSDR